MFYGQRDKDLVQFKPARAKKKFSEVEEITSVQAANTYNEQKIDGERYMIHTNRPTRDGRFLHGVTSRRESVVTGRFVEKTDRVPHIANNKQLPPDSLLDSEFVSSADAMFIDFPGRLWDKLLEPNHPHMLWLRDKYDGKLPVYPHVGNTVSIMGSLGPEAVCKQEERGKIWAYAFDIPQYLGQNATKNRQLDRRRLLARILSTVNPEDGIVLMPAWANLTVSELQEFFYMVTDAIPPGVDGGEGLILKEYDKPYNHATAWWKLKKDYPVDCVLTGAYTMGKAGVTGKMLGFVGALEIGVYDRIGQLLPIGNMSAIMDSEAKLAALTDAAINGELRGKVVEGRHNGLQEDITAPHGYTLRHPRFRRWREDKNADECTFEVLKAEVQRVSKQ